MSNTCTELKDIVASDDPWQLQQKKRNTTGEGVKLETNSKKSNIEDFSLTVLKLKTNLMFLQLQKTIEPEKSRKPQLFLFKM